MRKTVTYNPVPPSPGVDVEVQSIYSGTDVPESEDLTKWVEAALAERRNPAEVVLRIVDEPESAQLNETYRGVSGPTNVLTFPFEAPPQVNLPLLGDLVICAPLVAREAQTQGKRSDAHWAHMVVHGVLHLLGYDHQNDASAALMEGLETRILSGLGYPGPYEEPTA